MEKAEEISLSGIKGRVWTPSPLRAVSIVAMGASAFDFVQDCYHKGPREKDHEIWTINSGVLCFQFDKVWNMHNLKKLRNVQNEVDYFPLYEKIEKPLITVEAFEELPSSIEFPIAKCIEVFRTNYFTNTICYMVAGALLCGVEELFIYGADYNYPGSQSYEKGRAGLEFWLGIAHARGVALHIAGSSTLLDMFHRNGDEKGAMGYGKVYGYFDRQPATNNEGKVIGFDPAPEEVPNVTDLS